MKQIIILVPEGQNNLSSIVGAYKILKRANAYWKEHRNIELFDIKLAGISKEVEFHEGLFSVKPQLHISEVAQAKLIIIPSLNHNYDQAINSNAEITAWIEHQYCKGAEIASICTGAFLLASAGILNGKTCST
ncbi:MAG: AraC family transcriptional regulator, partial [Pedobacter sp.]